MSWVPSVREIEAVELLSPVERYEYLLKRVADTEQIWSLHTGRGWALAGGSVDGEELMPVWPHPAFASRCAEGSWADAQPRVISLEDLLGKWLPGLARDRRSLAVFPTPVGQHAVVAPDVMLRDLRQHLADAYGEDDDE